MADELRPGVAEVIALLHQLGVGWVVLLTGDNPRAASAIAAQAGVDDWRARLLPVDKSAVAELRRAHGTTVMISDGVNDAPGLPPPMSAQWSMSSPSFPQAVRLARHALGTICQSVALLLATIAVLIAAALAGRLS
jgi:P-type E1-E2 ATPase